MHQRFSTSFLSLSASVCLSFLLFNAVCSVGYADSKLDIPLTGQGILVGEVTDHSAVLQVRLTTSDQLVDRDLPGTAGVVKFMFKATHSPDFTFQVGARADSKQDFIARVVIQKLQPSREYTCTTQILKNGQSYSGPTATFKTLPGKSKQDAVNFVVVTGMNYAKFHGDDRIDKKQHLLENNTKLPTPYQGKDKHLGYPALETIRLLKPDFFIGTGDNVYYDTPDNPRAKTIPELRQKWHEQFVQPRFRNLFASVPTYWMVDDHDYRIDDGDNSGDYDPTPEVARKMMLEQLPYAGHEDKDVKTYRTHRINKDLQIWFVENRIYRSHNEMQDGPEKTIWGAEQKDWLKQTLLQSDAEFKLLISPTPMVGPDDLRKFDNHTNINGFRHERDEFFAWLKETGIDQNNFYIVCGDRHWQYHALHPTGIEEFSCGALIDANSRLGRSPGDPQSTDPKGLIKQLYTQKERSGGFLEIRTIRGLESKPSLEFVFHDEKGKVLYAINKPGK
ncbi:MAG: alkaline phosphatase D family protein [Planctomycetaceae bacterium]|nr:alkaline phosphatase D family protein [Planctomycetaceae bacterium]